MANRRERLDCGRRVAGLPRSAEVGFETAGGGAPDADRVASLVSSHNIVILALGVAY
jgi:hypothetical protein